MKYISLFAFLLVALATMAQPEGKIAGRIISKTEKAAHNATVSLLHAEDSAAVRQTLANVEGHYRFDAVADGNYLIMVTAIGHRKSLSKPLQIHPGQRDIQVAPIALIPLSKDLSGVTVTAKRPLLEHKIDRTIVNVDALVTNTGVTALEVLENAPLLS